MAYANIMDFGAKGTGVPGTETDDTTAIMAAIATGKTVFIPAPSGHYRINSQIALPSYTVMETEMPFTRIRPIGHVQPFYIVGTYIKFGGMIYDGSEWLSGDLMNINNSQTRSHIYIDDILGTNCKGRILAEVGNAQGRIWHLNINNIKAQLHKAAGIDLITAYGFNNIRDTCIDYVGTETAATGIRISGAQGMDMKNCQVLGSAQYNGIIPGQMGIHIIGSEAVNLENCHADSLRDHGIYIESSDYIYLHRTVASLCKGWGFVANGVNNTDFVQCHGDNNAGHLLALGNSNLLFADGMFSGSGVTHSLSNLATQQIRNTKIGSTIYNS